jgi:hypothetical protein
MVTINLLFVIYRHYEPLMFSCPRFSITLGAI